MNDYAIICENYGITESAMYNYLIETMDKNELDYQSYVNKCKNNGKIPMSKDAYLNRKRKIKKGLIIGASIAAAGTGAAVGGHFVKNTDWYKKARAKNLANKLENQRITKLYKKGKRKKFFSSKKEENALRSGKYEI